MPDHLGRLVLDHLDFTLSDGEIVAILGKSGSGKSTFLRILAGLVPPSDGVVEYRGHQVTEPVHGIAMVFQILCAVSVADRARQCRTRSRGARRLRRRAAAARGRRDRRDRARRVRDRLSEGAVGRHAAARRLCPGARRQPRHPAARRAVLIARRADRGDIARRSSRSVGRPAASRPKGSSWFRTTSRRRSKSPTAS